MSANTTEKLELGFVTGPRNSEDIAPIPGTKWMLASGMAGPEHPQGHLYLVDTVAKTSEEIFPSEVAFEPASGALDEQPPDVSVFDAHGISLRPGENGQHTLYVVNHGGREAIEVLSVDASGERPRLTWIGAVIQAPGVWGNAVNWLSDGGIVVTNYLDLNDDTAFDKVYAGENTGNLKEWHEESGWTDVPGTECCAPNGVGASADGRWWFICSWSTKTFIRVSRGAERVQRDEIPVDCLADNVKFDADGKVLIAGQMAEPKAVFATYFDDVIANFPALVLRIDPETLEVEELARGWNPDFGTAATGLYVDGELWISNARGDRIAYLLDD